MYILSHQGPAPLFLLMRRTIMSRKNFEWATVEYEGDRYDVCVGMEVEEVDEIRPIDSEVNITPVMRIEVINWMLEKAMEGICQAANDPVFLDMSQREREIDEAGLVYEDH
jgi:predicted DNA-binding ribbon-helix-helix protein